MFNANYHCEGYPSYNIQDIVSFIKPSLRISIK